MKMNWHLRLALGLALLLVTALASADTHADWCRRAVASLPVFHEDRDYVEKAEQLEAVADAVAKLSVSPPGGIAPRAWAALMLTVAFHESGLSERIQRGDFKPHEADAHKVNGVLMHRARGLWQVHANSLNQADWEIANGNLEAQARLADQGLRRGFWTCSRSGAPFPQGAINGFAGKMCTAKWGGLSARANTFSRLVAR